METTFRHVPPVVSEIAIWWAAQMRALLPGARREGQADALIIAIDRLEGDVSGSILLRRDGVETMLQPLAQPIAITPHLPIGLRLPPGAVLCRDVLLPLAALRDLQTVIGFEMDRLTPFSREELFWSISNVTPDRARGRLSLRLTIVPRAQITSLTPHLAGLAPAFIEAEAGRIELGPLRRPARALRPALCGLLFLVCLAVPFIRQQMALDDAAQTIAATQPAADTAQGLRRQLLAAAAGHSAIAAARRAGDALQVLSILTNALPDGTWLTDLTLKSGDLTFDGQSDNAAQLIGLLSTVPGLHDPSFTAPVTRTADGKADLFSMHVSVGP